MRILKIEFIEDEKFIIDYYSEEKLQSEEELKIFFKRLNTILQKKYSYELRGFYNVTIYCEEPIYVMIFENIDDFGRADFNITMLLNSVLLFEFAEEDMILGTKIYYQEKYYVELDQVKENPYLFEYGTVIFGDKVEEILARGVLMEEV